MVMLRDGVEKIVGMEGLTLLHDTADGTCHRVSHFASAMIDLFGGRLTPLQFAAALIALPIGWPPSSCTSRGTGSCAACTGSQRAAWESPCSSGSCPWSTSTAPTPTAFATGAPGGDRPGRRGRRRLDRGATTKIGSAHV